MNKECFKITLEAARVNAGMSQEQAAELCGVTRFTISNWERGFTHPNKGQLIGLSHIYQVPLEHIFLPSQVTNCE